MHSCAFKRHTWKLPEYSKTSSVFRGFHVVNFKKSFLFENVGNFRGFRVFDLSPYTERKLGNIFKTCKFQRICFIWGSTKFLRFPCFWFRPLYWNWKLRKLGNIFKTYKFQRICFTWGSWKFSRFPSFGFLTLYWNQKFTKLGNIFKTFFKEYDLYMRN